MIVDPALWSDRIPVCSRHGNPVVVRAKARFRSRPPVWLGASIAVAVAATALPSVFPSLRYPGDSDPELYLLSLSAVMYVSWIVHNAVLKIVEGTEWGFCSHCRARRNVLALGAVVSLMAMLFSIALYVPFVLPELADEKVPTILEVFRWIVLFAPLFFIVTAVVFLSYARWAMIARGVARRDGRTVELRRPAPEFARAALGLLTDGADATR
jgi:hypothetical protein